MSAIFSSQKLFPLLLTDWTDLEVDTLVRSTRTILRLQAPAPVDWMGLQRLLHSNLKCCKLQSKDFFAKIMEMELNILVY